MTFFDPGSSIHLWQRLVQHRAWAEAAEAEEARLAEQYGAHARAARAERARLVDRVAKVECAARDALETADRLAAQTARAEAAETEQTRLAVIAEQYREHAEDDEAERARLTARVAELERALSDEQRSRRIAELSAAVAVKRARLDNATAAKAVAKADARTASELDDAQTCLVCMAAPRQMLYQPCLHLAVCSGCNDKLVRHATDDLSVAARRRGLAAKPLCPICRAKADVITGPVFT
jgi:hypothetical protein